MKVQLGSAPAVVALVLFFAAAVPSNATQHRDPVMPESTQKAQPPASPQASDSVPAKVHKNARSHTVNPVTEAKQKKVTKKSSPASTKNSDSNAQPGLGTGMK